MGAGKVEHGEAGALALGLLGEKDEASGPDEIVLASGEGVIVFGGTSGVADVEGVGGLGGDRVGPTSGGGVVWVGGLQLSRGCWDVDHRALLASWGGQGRVPLGSWGGARSRHPGACWTRRHPCWQALASMAGVICRACSRIRGEVGIMSRSALRKKVWGSRSRGTVRQASTQRGVGIGGRLRAQGQGLVKPAVWTRSWALA